MSSPRKLFRRPMRKTDLPILPYDPTTIVYDVADTPTGDPYVNDGRLNLDHLQRVLAARDEAEARQLKVVSQ